MANDVVGDKLIFTSQAIERFRGAINYYTLVWVAHVLAKNKIKKKKKERE